MKTKRMNVQLPIQLLDQIDIIGKNYPTRNAVIVSLLNRGIEVTKRGFQE